jgi:hypothetical protein
MNMDNRERLGDSTDIFGMAGGKNGPSNVCTYE